MTPRHQAGKNPLDRIDARMVRFMSRHGIRLLRIALGVVFLWFGVLKVVGKSPVVELVSRTVYWVSPEWFVPFLGYWEMAVGLGLLFGVALRLTLLCFWLQMAGTFLVLVLHPDLAFQHGNPLLLTMEGEFVIKNLVLIAAGLAVGGTVPRGSGPRGSERGGALIRWVFALLLVAVASVAGAAGWIFGTTSGSLWLLRQAFDRYVPSQTLIIGEAEGTLLRGFRVRNVEMPGLDRFGAGTLRLDEASVSPLWPQWLEALRFRARGVELRGTRWVDTVTAAEVESGLRGRVELRDVRADGILRFPPESSVEVQQILVELPFRIERIRSIQNARLRLPYAEPIVFFGTQDEIGAIAVRMYARTLDIQGLLEAVSASASVGAITGTVRDIDLTLAGTISRLNVSGRLRASRVTRRNVSLVDAPIDFNVTGSGWPGPPALEGKVGLFRATLQTPQTAIRVEGGTISFDGDPARPHFNVHGTASVGGTRISITFKGTRDQPDLTLTSDPPLPETALLIMLATGKPWRGTQEAITQGKIPLDLAGDFVDYFFFGGMGAKIAKRFGISDIALRHNAEQRTIGVETTFADRFNVGVEVPSGQTDSSTGSDSASGVPAAPIQPYKIDAEYRLTDTTSVEVAGEHGRAPGGASTVSNGTSAQPAAEPEANDTVLLKLKKRF